MLSDIVEGIEVSRIKAGPASKFGDFHDGSVQFVVNSDKGISEVSYFYGDRKPRNIIVISSQTGCHYGCNFCELGKEKPVGDINLSAQEMYEQAVLMLHVVMQDGIDINSFKHKITVANTGEPLFNPNLVSGLEILTELGTSFKISTIFPPGEKARRNFKELAEFTSRYQKPIQLQISLISTSPGYRQKVAGVKLSSFEEIRNAAEYWMNLNPQRKVNLSLILTGENPCSVDDVYKIFPPELFRFRLRPYMPTENGRKNLLLGINQDKLDGLKESFRRKGYEISNWAESTDIEKKFGLASNVTRNRYLKENQ